LNPPKDAHDPDEWKDFFETNFEDCHVAVCTVDMDNDHVLKLVIERRNLLRRLELNFPEHTSPEMANLEEEARKTEETKKGCLSKLISPSLPKIVARLKDVIERLRTELKKDSDFPVTNVFVTFETEKAQREVLGKLTVGSIAARNNDTSAVSDPKYLFRGQHVLEIDEPEEPSSIRWQELNATKTAIGTRLVVTSVITGGVLYVGFLLVKVSHNNTSAYFSYLVISTLLFLYPFIANMLTLIEFHRSESSRQKWMFIRIAICYITLTTIALSVITPFLSTLDSQEGIVQGLVPSVHNLFLSQIVYNLMYQVSDPLGQISRHVLAPRAKTQEAMNMLMRGTEIYLAERYAHMVKFMYLMIWYCVIYPSAFFMGSFSLFVGYFTDRFSLMRTWARTPQVGSHIANFARTFFTPAAFVLMAIISGYYWSGFPYDNLCEDHSTPLDPEYLGHHSFDYNFKDTTFLGFTLITAADINVSFTIEPDAQVYKFCDQDLRGWTTFPPLPTWQEEGSEWMTPDQEDVVSLFGWVAVGMLAGGFAVFLPSLYKVVASAFRGI
jgi:hypothetical protein